MSRADRLLADPVARLVGAALRLIGRGEAPAAETVAEAPAAADLETTPITAGPRVTRSSAEGFASVEDAFPAAPLPTLRPAGQTPLRVGRRGLPPAPAIPRVLATAPAPLRPGGPHRPPATPQAADAAPRAEAGTVTPRQALAGHVDPTPDRAPAPSTPPAALAIPAAASPAADALAMDRRPALAGHDDPAGRGLPTPFTTPNATATSASPGASLAPRPPSALTGATAQPQAAPSALPSVHPQAALGLPAASARSQAGDPVADTSSPTALPLPSASPTGALPLPPESARPGVLPGPVPAPLDALPLPQDPAPGALARVPSPFGRGPGAHSPSTDSVRLLEPLADSAFPLPGAPITPAQRPPRPSVHNAPRRPVDPFPRARALPLAPALPDSVVDTDTQRQLARYGLRLAPVAAPPAPASPASPPGGGLTLAPDGGPRPDSDVPPSTAPRSADTATPFTRPTPSLAPRLPGAPTTQSFRAAPAANAAPAPLQAEDLEPILEQLLTQALLREGVDL